MKRIFKKLRSTRGETLAETLVSIAILGLSITLMLTMIATSAQITKKTRDKDQELVTELDAAEKQIVPFKENVTVTITGTGSTSGSAEVTVDLYADSTLDNPLISYLPK